jgi:hypothetical protein
LVNSNSPQDPPLTAPRSETVLIAAIVGCAMLLPCEVRAQWWSRSPVDFEECADLAEKITAREARTSALAECNAKFAGRRKPGGGYSYFDFMQNRTFDIAGPNPTPDEQRHIDEQYTAYLENQRRKSIRAAFLAKQQQMQQASQKSGIEKASFTTPSLGKPRTAPSTVKRIRTTATRTTTTEPCRETSFECEWPRLSEHIKDLKKALFGSPPSKAGKI